MREPLFVHTHSLVIPKGDNTPEIDVTITIREGATPEMIVETLDHYCIAVRALWSGDVLGDDKYNRVKIMRIPHTAKRGCAVTVRRGCCFHRANGVAYRLTSVLR